MSSPLLRTRWLTFGLRAVPAARVRSLGVFHLHVEMTNYFSPMVSPKQLQSHLPGALRDV